MSEAGPKRSKLEATSRPVEAKNGELEVIVKVRRARHVPACVAVRAQISDHMFTSVIREETLQVLEDDPDVQSVAISRRLQSAS